MDNGIDPVKQPVMIVGKQPYKVRMTMLQRMWLGEAGIKGTVREITDADGTRTVTIFSLREMMELVAIGMSSSAKRYTVEEVAEMIEQEEIRPAFDAVVASLSKTQPQASNAQAA